MVLHRPKLEKYFHFQRETPRTECKFLQLPSALRRKIYFYAGAPRGRPINMFLPQKTVDGDVCKPTELFDDRFYYGFNDNKLFRKLSLTCRVVHDEVVTIWFGENFIHCELNVLELISARALQALMFLDIRMTPCPCPTWSCTFYDGVPGEDRHSYDRWSHKGALGCISRRDKSIIKQWQRVMQRLAANITPSKAKIQLFCRVKDQETAGKVLEPIRNLKSYQDIGVSLGVCGSEVHQMAVSALVCLAGKKEPFRFFDLPRELQCKILEYTCLGSPTNADAIGGRALWYDNDGPGSFRPDVDRKMYEVTYPQSWWKWASEDDLCLKLQGSRCSCTSFHARYFLVNRRFNEIATSVFFSKNRFMLFATNTYGEDYGYPRGLNSSHRCNLARSLTEFLRKPHSKAFQEITHLLIFLPELSKVGIRVCKNITNCLWFHTWLRVIHLLRCLIDPKRLRLEIHVPESTGPSRDDFLGGELVYFLLRDVLTPAELLRTAYQDIFKPLRLLGGLKCLFVHIHGEEHMRSPSLDQNHPRDLEEQLERSVMGDAYDSTARGKPPTRDALFDFDLDMM